MERLFITKEDAKWLLPDMESIHTFRSGSRMLIGADWSRKELIKAIDKAGPKDLEIGGDACKAMGHAFVIHTGGPLFIEVYNKLIDELENKYSL